MAKLILFSTILVQLVSTIAFADSSLSSLRGTAWSGTFSVSGYSGKLSMEFAKELDAQGRLAYRLVKLAPENFPPIIAWTLRKFDTACEFTPRYLQETPSGDGRTHGMISVYECAASAQAEKALSQAPGRRAKIVIPTISDLSEAGRLKIVAEIGPRGALHVNYDLSQIK